LVYFMAIFSVPEYIFGFFSRKRYPLYPTTKVEC
jgi:hypothetical protein